MQSMSMLSDSLAAGISFLCLLQAEIYVFPVSGPPYWFFHFQFGTAGSPLTALNCWTSKTQVQPLEFRFYVYYKLRYRYFRFIGRHLGFQYVRQVVRYRHMHHCVGHHRKYGGSRWNCVSMWLRTRDTLGGNFPPPCATSVCKKRRATARLMGA